MHRYDFFTIMFGKFSILTRFVPSRLPRLMGAELRPAVVMKLDVEGKVSGTVFMWEFARSPVGNLSVWHNDTMASNQNVIICRRWR